MDKYYLYELEVEHDKTDKHYVIFKKEVLEDFLTEMLEVSKEKNKRYFNYLLDCSDITDNWNLSIKSIAKIIDDEEDIYNSVFDSLYYYFRDNCYEGTKEEIKKIIKEWEISIDDIILYHL